MSLLLDTDICSAYMKGQPQVGSRVLQHSGRLHISVITLGELSAWVLRASAPRSREQGLTALLRGVDVLDLNEDIARRFGAAKAALLDQGRPTPEMDLLIGATALVHGLTLVTHNVQDYVHIPGLTVVDWLAS